jgi:CspA family cold shock protein
VRKGRKEADMAKGEVKWFNNAKGWGFILADDGTEAFVHYSDIEGDGFRALYVGETVEFELADGPKGAKAVHVQRSDAPPES